VGNASLTVWEKRDVAKTASIRRGKGKNERVSYNRIGAVLAGRDGGETKNLSDGIGKK